MKFQASLSRITLHPKQYDVIDKYVEGVVKEAARIWVRAALEIIPSWSGASRATLQSLASAVNEHVAIDIKSKAPDRISLGRLYSRGGVTRNGQGSWEFYYETQLNYLIANETTKVAPRTNGLRGSLVSQTPYKFREAGNQAVQAYLQTVDLPLIPLISQKI